MNMSRPYSVLRVPKVPHRTVQSRWGGAISVVAASLGVLVSMPVRADSPPIIAAETSVSDMDRAKVELAIGQTHYDEARYDDALVAFEAAYAAYPQAEFQYDIGLCRERLGQIDGAIAAFEAYLLQKVDAADNVSVQRRIAVLREQLPVVDAVPPARPRASGELIDPFRDSGTSAPSGRGRRAPRPLVVGGAVAMALGIGIGVGGGLGFGLPLARRRGDQSDLLLAGQVASVAVGGMLLATGIALVIVGKRRTKPTRAVAWLSASRRGLAIAGRF